MDVKLKQRLVGTLVLTMVAIVILPILLDGVPEERTSLQIDIADAPSFEIERMDMAAFRARMAQMAKHSRDKLPIEFPDAPDDEVSGLPANSGQGDDRSASRDQYQLDANQLPVSWAIQLGSFRSKINAVTLRQSLRAAGQTAYILASHDEQGQLFRVLVGPMLNRQKLSSIAATIETEFKLRGQIIRYRSSDDVNLLGG